MHPYVIDGHTVNLDVAPEESGNAVEAMLHSGNAAVLGAALWILCSEEFARTAAERDELRERVTKLEARLDNLAGVVP